MSHRTNESPDCTWAADALIERREGRLSRDTLARLARHLAECDSCRGEQSDEAWLRDELSRFPASPTADDVQYRVRSAMRRRRTVRSTWVTAAVVCLAVVTATTFLRLQQESERPVAVDTAALPLSPEEQAYIVSQAPVAHELLADQLSTLVAELNHPDLLPRD